ncbi:hypothetical protein [Streptomyces achromogenes]|uniref:hypothetical protein n=1 Tax=Streptomyces achromogenes TaxID=67255 RepID=UPI0033F97253
MRELGIPLPDEETDDGCLLARLAFGLAEGELSPKDVGNGLSMTVAARTREEIRFLSVAAGYSEWLGPDELSGWEKELRTAAHSLAAVTDLGPSSVSRRRAPAD